jgi:hypothetical protein
MKTKNSATNLMLNSIIFLILALIVYLIYSIFIKINSNSIEVENRNVNKVSEIIQVEVLNGCGIKGVGERFTDFLRNNNVDVVYTGNYKSFDVDKTLIVDRIGNMANAKKIAELLGVKEKNIIQQINEEYFLDVSIIVGGDYYNLTPLK